MYIIHKNKDYYDYYSHIYGEYKSITFDRRGSIVITDENFINFRENYSFKDGQFIVLEVGTVQYLIRVYNIIIVNDYYNHIYDKYISSNIEIVNVFKNHINKFGSPLSIKKVDVKLEYNRKYEKFFNYSEYFPTTYEPILLPILANTRITSLIPAEDIWKELSNYISSLKNDKDSVYVSDIEKVVNHGFDKRESFRSIK